MYQSAKDDIRVYNQRKKLLEKRDQSKQKLDSDTYYATFDEQLALEFGHAELNLARPDYRPRPQYYQYGKFPSEFAYAVSAARFEELAKRQIRPLDNVLSVHTIYDKTLRPMDHLQNELELQSIDQSVLGILYRILWHFRLDIVIFVLFTLFC